VENEMITIYGSPRSSSGRCFWTLEEIGIEYQDRPIDFLNKEHKSQDYLELNPNGKIPVLTDGEFVIWESMAINMYLAEKYRPELLGADAETRGLVYQWSIWSIGELQSPLIDIFIQKVFVPEDKRDNAAIQKAKDKLPALLSILDKELSGKTYLAGANFSLADLNTASVVHICKHLKYELTEYKDLCKWLDLIDKREAFKRYTALCD
jgi:glutathione S-transferase